MSIKIFDTYLKGIKNKADQGTEHTYRTDLENLLNIINKDKKITIIQEAKKTQEKGKPDYKIIKNGGF